MKSFKPLHHPSRARALSLSAALLAFFLMAVEPSYASSTMQVYVNIPNTPATPFPGGDDYLDPNPGAPSLLELDSVKTVDASSMALISVAARKVELARLADGAREVAKEIIAAKYQWSEKQFTCLDQLWIKESHWNYKARNKVTGAHGIAQALPATKMEIIGTDWRTNPVTQITWGLKYIEERYETPCKAWSKFKRSRWY